MARKRRPGSGWQPLAIRKPNVEPRDRSFLERLNDVNRKIWKARDEFVQNFEANFPDSFRAVVADYASQFADGTPKHRIKTFEQLLLEKQSERKDDLIRQEGFVAAIATVKAQLRRNALNANAVKQRGIRATERALS